MGIWLSKSLVLVGCSTEGTGDYEPTGAVTENGFTYNDFSFLSDGQETTVMVKGGADYELVDVRKNGVYLERIVVHESSNADAPVDWPAGPKRIWTVERPVWTALTNWAAIGSSVTTLTVPVPATPVGQRAQLVLENVGSASDDKWPYLQCGYSTGPTIDTGNNYSFAGLYAGPGGTLGAGSGTDSLTNAIALAKVGTGHGVGSAAGEVFSTRITFTPLTGELKTFSVESSYIRPDGEAVDYRITGRWNSTFAITALRLGINGPTNFKNNTGRWRLLAMRD